VASRFFHISDLHLGRRETPEPYRALLELRKRLDPQVLVVSGDLTHRGRRSELEHAQDLLEALEVPLLAVPGNHDIPYTFPARFTTTFAEWKRVFGTTEPEYVSDELALVGLNSVRPWRQQQGALESSLLARAASKLERAPTGALRVAVLHHHLAAPPWRAARKRPLHGRDETLQSLAVAGTELILGGHVHQAAIAERREFEALDGTRGGSLVLATAPGFSRVRPHRRGEALGFNVIESEVETLAVVTYAWDGAQFEQLGRRSFPRTRNASPITPSLLERTP
jgi:3',5'-cyclic AMP phosphodiesterase CpdA